MMRYSCKTPIALRGLGLLCALALLGLPARGQAQSIKDGTFSVTAAGTVLNLYTPLSADAAAGATSISVTNIADLTATVAGSYAAAALEAGDLLFVIQMQGATIDTTNTVNYGNVTSLGSAGSFEFVRVGSISGNTISLDTTAHPNGLARSYTAAGRTQVIRVPQYTALSVEAAASVVAPPWNGATGGVVVLSVQGTVTLNGSINVSGRGFRGGAVDNATSVNGVTDYVTTDPARGGLKGEGIAGPSTNAYGRGASANGGGGGVGHNSAGGGGANGNNGNPWTGQGVMVAANANEMAAWALDPGYVANGNALTTSSGGGRGGYTFGSNNANELVAGGAPGQNSWGGDNRREAGGLGGRPMANDPVARLFMGGGGGAGDGNNGAAGAGGAGGGLVFLLALDVSGAGQILANGAAGGNTVGGHNDAAGGGGAGGTIVVSSQQSLGGISLSANGGVGGNQLITSNENEGPGGGGGGGYMAVFGGTLTTSAQGGAGGTTTSQGVTDFPKNGATGGNLGQPNEMAQACTALPYCPFGNPPVADLDTDGDGVPDSVERPNGQDIDTDMDGTPDYQDTDDDGDGILTRDERPNGENRDSDGDGKPDYLDSDDDNDGILTRLEDLNTDRDPRNDDFDRDGIPNYLDPDDDNDGVPTSRENPDPNSDGNPSDAQNTDGDGFPDYLDTDDDGDGLITTEERPNGQDRDTDKDGKPDYIDADDDADGLPTPAERPSSQNRDTDGDGTPDHLDPDDDGDGAPTLLERPGGQDGDFNDNGVADHLDPTTSGLVGGALCAAQPASATQPGLLLSWCLALLGLTLTWRRRRSGEKDAR